MLTLIHLVKVVFGRLSHCQVTIFYLQILFFGSELQSPAHIDENGDEEN